MDEAMAQAKVAAAAAWRNVPEGYELVAKEDTAWRLVTGKRCRHVGGAVRKACGRPSVAELDRRAWRSGDHAPNWWAYCDNPDHLYSRWVEDGRVMHWILREISDEATP